MLNNIQDPFERLNEIESALTEVWLCFDELNKTNIKLSEIIKNQDQLIKQMFNSMKAMNHRLSVLEIINGKE